MDHLFEIVGVLLCFVLSALFSGSETALTALGVPSAERLLDSDPGRYRPLKLWVTHPFRTLATILVGRRVVIITAAALTTHLSLEIFGEGRPAATPITLAVIITTVVILLAGEMLPKVVSKRATSSLAVPSIRFVGFVYYLLYPFTGMLARLTRSTLTAGSKALGHPSNRITEDDIEYLISLGKQEGSLTGNKERLLESVFEFGDTTVKEVMVPRVELVAVPDDVSFQELIKTLVDCGHSRIPVYHESVDDIVGVFYAKDVLKFCMTNRTNEEFRLGEYLRQPVFVPTSKKVEKLFTEFQQRRIHIAVVVDEFGGTAGVVTLEDLIEEFFGEIQDEFDQEEPMLRAGENGQRIADARISLYELEQALGLTFPEDHDYESLGGFISDQMGRVPAPGNSLTYNGYIFTVAESEPTHIVSVLIEAKVPSGPQEAVEKNGEAHDDDDEKSPTGPSSLAI